MKSSEAPVVRCAIYTRKSVDERADTQFSTLENQREFCRNYIASQRGEGWIELADRFDDGGYSGGNLDRPALARLRADIAARRVDVVVVYKIDRLSRSLRDFANLVSEFEAGGATFVSVTQNFSTSTSMGRLTLNVLLSFAQFERELIGDRLKDWRAGARSRGLWIGHRPFGYRVVDNRLVVDPDEAAVVRRIFSRYPNVGSCRIVADELFSSGVLNRFGRPITGNMVGHMIKHRVYRGEIVHRKNSLPGTHEPIVTEAVWRKANNVYENSRWRRRALVEQPVEAMLKGMIFDATGARMHHTFMHAKGRLYRYYVAQQMVRRYGREASPRYRAPDLEAVVLQTVERLAGVKPMGLSRAANALVRRLVERVDIRESDISIAFRTGAVISAPQVGRLGWNRRTAQERAKTEGGDASRRGAPRPTRSMRSTNP